MAEGLESEVVNVCAFDAYYSGSVALMEDDRFCWDHFGGAIRRIEFVDVMNLAVYDHVANECCGVVDIVGMSS